MIDHSLAKSSLMRYNQGSSTIGSCGGEEMTYSEELSAFTEICPYKQMVIENAVFRYVLAGLQNMPTLVFLNGGMNVSEMWMRYVDELSKDYQVLIFDYPQELKTNQALVSGMKEFFDRLGIQNPILIGSSYGAMVAQIYTQKYPNAVSRLILISTGGMDSQTIKSLKKKYLFAPIMLWYMKHCNYEKLKPRLIRAFTDHAKDESEANKAYAKDMAETIFRDYSQEKDLHISTLLVDLLRQTPVTASTFSRLKGHILLILPDKDFFSEAMQNNLIVLMHDPRIKYVSGGHLSTVFQAAEYMQEIRTFLTEQVLDNT